MLQICFNHDYANGGLILDLDIINDNIYSKTMELNLDDELHSIWDDKIIKNPKKVKLYLNKKIITINMKKFINAITNIICS